MQSKFLVRLARAADIPAMHAIRLAVSENRLGPNAPIDEASYLPFVAAKSVWAAWNDEIVGFAALDLRAGSIWALFVSPVAEGRGVGRALLETMQLAAVDRGLTRLSLSTGNGTRALLFYEAAGWSRSGETATGEIVFERKLPSPNGQ